MNRGTSNIKEDKKTKKLWTSGFKFQVSGFNLQEKGFTLFEILLALGIFALIAAVAVFLPPTLKESVDLDGQSRQIIEVLNIGQSNAKSRFKQSSWGVHLEGDHYVLFKGESYSPDDASNQIYYLAGGLEISNIKLNGGGQDIVFEELSGQTQKFGDFRVGFIANPSEFREIRIDFSGRAAIATSVLSPQDSRVFDSRHVHFQLGWTIKNSTKLIFLFPRVSQVEEILMEEYLNAYKTDFDWSGSFTVDGGVQGFKVHTHSLGVFDSLVSVTRDRSGGKNNEAVRIYIEYEGQNREIARYAADGSVEVGDYGGIMTIQ